jgi:hypothetical protein
MRAPMGEMKTSPALAPLFISDPSKMMLRLLPPSILLEHLIKNSRATLGRGSGVLALGGSHKGVLV